MVYIQVTTRCNLFCSHCVFACTKSGIDMTLPIFEKTIDMLENYSNSGKQITLGGGEPTLNKKLFRMILYAKSKGFVIHIITNGTLQKKSLLLAKLARRKTIHIAALSRDKYHRGQIDIHPSVKEAFENPLDLDTNFCSGPVTFTYIDSEDLIKSGRSMGGNDKCPTDCIFINPNGSIRQCGCENSPTIGHVFYGISDQYKCIMDMWDTCYKRNSAPVVQRENSGPTSQRS